MSEEFVAFEESVESASRQSYRDHEETPDDLRLFHFTDTVGLLGILREKVIWATMARCSNDSSEIYYGERIALNYLRSRIGDKRIGKRISAIFSPRERNGEPVRFPWQPFVCSFCAAEESSALWFHYGRSGTGLAIEVFPSLLRSKSTRLLQVQYRQGNQLDLLDSLFSPIIDRMQWAEELSSSRDKSRARGMIVRRLVEGVRVVSTLLKHPSFESENEWRLIYSYWPALKALSMPELNDLQPLFRAVQGRVVPYVAMPLPFASIRQIVLGAQCPIQLGDTGLQLLLDHYSGREQSPSVMRSSIPVRI